MAYKSQGQNNYLIQLEKLFGTKNEKKLLEAMNEIGRNLGLFSTNDDGLQGRVDHSFSSLEEAMNTLKNEDVRGYLERLQKNLQAVPVLNSIYDARRN
jgi:hypothetical protein